MTGAESPLLANNIQQLSAEGWQLDCIQPLLAGDGGEETISPPKDGGRYLIVPQQAYLLPSASLREQLVYPLLLASPGDHLSTQKTPLSAADAAGAPRCCNL